MAETIDVPAVGKVNKTYVYVGLAGAAGIVGYAWWTRSRRPATPTWDVDSVGETEYRAPQGGGTNSSYTGEKPAGINSNTQWATAAVEYLQQGGTEFGLASVAVGKFLLRQPLSPNEENAIKAVIGPLGEPPEGRPWKIIAKPTADRQAAPDLSRFTPIAGSPFFFITAREGETWEDLVSRGYGGLAKDSAGFGGIVAAVRDINNHVTTPKAGDLIALR